MDAVDVTRCQSRGREESLPRRLRDEGLNASWLRTPPLYSRPLALAPSVLVCAWVTPLVSSVVLHDFSFIVENYAW
jgi:hypothetical protein